MERKFTILIVDDDQSIISLLIAILENSQYSFITATNGEEALSILDSKRVDIVLQDFQMPGMDGFELLKAIRKHHPQVKVFMLTGYGSVDMAVEALHSGAVDFFQKPFSAPTLVARVAHHYRLWELGRENLRLRKKAAGHTGIDDIVGNSPPMRKLQNLLVRAAASDANVLIMGETGTGKEIAARCIHSLSARASKPFVAVDCASISESILESELFGHEKGAFTQAHASTTGLVRSADGGTLFLDETGEMPLSIQSKFLRFLQTREVRPVGSTRTYPVDIRVVCATNKNLSEEVEKGTFRGDLYYRLNVIPVSTPPLRECREDIVLLAAHFLKRFSARLGAEKKLDKATIRCLESYCWPGNVRELENALQRAAVLSDETMIAPDDLPTEVREAAQPSSTNSDAAMPLGDSLEDYEKAAFTNALKKSGGNRNQAAKILGVGQATLYRKLEKFGLK